MLHPDAKVAKLTVALVATGCTHTVIASAEHEFSVKVDDTLRTSCCDSAGVSIIDSIDSEVEGLQTSRDKVSAPRETSAFRQRITRNASKVLGASAEGNVVTLVLLNRNRLSSEYGEEWGTVQVMLEALSSDAMSNWGSSLMPSEDHPLTRHNGGATAEYDSCCGAASNNHRRRPTIWKPARTLAVQAFEGMQEPSASIWQVPAFEHGSLKMIDDDGVPPVANVTAMYGINLPTPRTVFLKHQEVKVVGGEQIKELVVGLQLDQEGDVEGLVCVDGIGYETEDVAQIRPDSGEQKFVSGDGTGTCMLFPREHTVPTAENSQCS